MIDFKNQKYIIFGLVLIFVVLYNQNVKEDLWPFDGTNLFPSPQETCNKRKPYKGSGFRYRISNHQSAPWTQYHCCWKGDPICSGLAEYPHTLNKR